MKDRPILFSAPMVRAILDGRKTVTRRIVRVDDTPIKIAPSEHLRNQRGIPSDAKNVRMCGSYVKTDAPPGSDTVSARVECPYGSFGDRLWVRETFAACRYEEKHAGCLQYRASGDDPDVRWRPSIFMPRKLSRITLGVMRVGVERLHAITEQDAIAEGVDNVGFPRETFAVLWDTINGKRAPWASNPWVWRVAFQKCGPDSEPVYGGPSGEIVGWTR